MCCTLAALSVDCECVGNDTIPLKITTVLTGAAFGVRILMRH